MSAEHEGLKGAVSTFFSLFLFCPDLCSPTTIRHPRTVLNLRNLADDLTVPLFAADGCQHIQSAMAREVEKYHTQQPEVRKWLESILQMVQKFNSTERLPLMVRQIHFCHIDHYF
jgi:hypothetical protein